MRRERRLPRVVVDTSVWVSAALTPAGMPARILDLLFAERFTLVVSEPLLAELTRVLSRPRLARRYGITQEVVAELTASLRLSAEFVEIEGEPQGCRDPNDDMLIETARVGNASILVSRDEDLTRDLGLMAVLKRYRITPLTIRRFLDRLEST